MSSLLKYPSKLIHRIQKLSKLYHKGQYRALINSIVTALPFFCMGGEMLAVAFYKGHREKFALFLASQLVGKQLNRVLKNYFAQPRPEAVPSKSHGMPSYHAQAAFFFFAALPSFHDTVLCDSRFRLVTLGLAMWIALTRIHLGRHTFMQVAAGAGLGGVLGMMFNYVVLELLRW